MLVIQLRRLEDIRAIVRGLRWARIVRQLGVILSASILVASTADAADSTITLNKEVYALKEPIVVEYQAAPSKKNDFITIVKQDVPAGKIGQYRYLGLKGQGRLQFNGFAAGAYEVRLHRYGSKEIEARAPFRVIDPAAPAKTDAKPAIEKAPPQATEPVKKQAAPAQQRTQRPSLEVAVTPIHAYEKIEIAFVAPGTANDWLTIVRRRAGGGEIGRFTMLEGRSEGIVSFDGLPPGEYEVRLFGGTRGRNLAHVSLVIQGEWREPEAAPAVRTEKPFYKNKETIVAHYEGAWIREEADHLVLAEWNRHDSSWTMWRTALHAPEGLAMFQGQIDGDYELRLYRGKSKNVVARYRFGVGDDIAEKYPEMTGGTLANAVGWPARCDVLVDWLAAWRISYPRSDNDAKASKDYWQWLAKPFLDADFKPIFGTEIRNISPTARAFIYPDLHRLCANLDPTYRSLLEGPEAQAFGGFESIKNAAGNFVAKDLTFEQALEAAEREPVAAKSLQAGEGLLDALTLDENAYDALRVIEANHAGDLVWAATPAAQHYRDTLERQREVAATAALKRRSEFLIASARDLPGAHTLAAFETEQAELFQHATSDTVASVRAAIDSAIATQLQPAVDWYMSRLSKLTAGSAGVRALSALYHEMIEKFGSLINHVPADQLMGTYIAREREIVPASVPELLGDVAALPTLEASNEFLSKGLGRPEAWELVRDTPLLGTLYARQVDLWKELEASEEPFWPLPDTGPAEEMARLNIGPAPLRASRPPMGHEIMLAIIREIESANGERVGPNSVIYRMLPFNAAMRSVSTLPMAFTLGLPNIEIPVEARIYLVRVSSVDCSPAARLGFKCSFRVSAEVEGAPDFFRRQMVDTFERSEGRWGSPTIADRLEESSVLAWGAIAQGLVDGFHAGGCVAGALGGVVDLACY